MGVALRTREMAVSDTARVAALRDLPREGGDVASEDEEEEDSRSLICSGDRTGKTSIPFRISSPRMRKTFNAPALATAAKGTRRVRIVRVPGERDLRRGTVALRPRATVQEAETATR